MAGTGSAVTVGGEEDRRSQDSADTGTGTAFLETRARANTAPLSVSPLFVRRSPVGVGETESGLRSWTGNRDPVGHRVVGEAMLEPATE